MHLIAEWWAAMYGNVFAISIWTVILFVIHHARLKKHISDSHEKWAAHVIETLSGQPGEESLSSGKEAIT